MEHPRDGLPLQETWDRDGVLIESWDERSDGNDRPPFATIKGKDWIYVEPQNQAPRLYRDPGETLDVSASLADSERDAYAMWLAALRACVGPDCHAENDVEFLD